MSMFLELKPAYMIAALFFLTCACYLYLCVVTFVSNAKSKSRDEYLSAGLCLTLYSFSYGLMTIAANETLYRIFWAIGFISGCLFFSRWLLFSSNMVAIKRKNVIKLIRAASVITLIVSGFCVLSRDTVFVVTKIGVQYSYQNSLLFKIMVIYTTIVIIALLYLDFRWWREAEMKRDRRQAFLFLILSFLIAPIGFATDFIIPAYTVLTAVPLAAICYLPVSMPLFISMRKYKTLSITVPNASGYVFTTVTIPTLVLDYNNVINLENKAASDFLGSCVIGRNISEIVFSGEKRPEQSFFDNDILSEKVTVETPSGPRICEMLLAVESDRYNDALCKVVLFKDITENEQKDQLLKEALVQANIASKAKSEFLSNMSHEIRTPMNAILGITEIQLQNDNLDQTMREALGKIYTSGDLLLGIINDILDLSKIESGKLELVIAKYETASFIYDTATLNTMRIDNKPIVFELSVSEETPIYLTGDELRIKQILNNILSNAFKYTEKGTVRLSVSVDEAQRAEDEITLIFSISDTGQGMTKEQVDKLFEQYTRFNMDVNRTTEGTGLGMSITRNLIHLMQGEIYVESQPGQGSTFTVHLPQKKCGVELIGKETAENLSNFNSINSTQLKRVQITREPMPYGSVLLVDDVETNIYVAQGLLAPYELQIDSAYSGFAAIDKIKGGCVYDIVFMDHMMPKMDGVEATKIIRDMGYDHPIVALTANAVLGQADVFMDNGFDDFISKPIDIRQMNIVLNKFIRDKQPPEVIEAARKRAKSGVETGAETSAKSGVETGAETSAKSGDETGAETSAETGAKSGVISGADSATALSTGGIVNNGGIGGRDSTPQPAAKRDFTEFFLRDARKALAKLDELSDKNDYTNESDLKTFLITVHGMKSALANIGNMDLSAIAHKLEMAGREGKLDIIISETPAFYNSLLAFTEELTPQKETASGENIEYNQAYLREKLLELKAACEQYNESAADEVLAQLREKAWPQQISELLGAIAQLMLHSEFDEAGITIDGFLT